MQYRPADLIGGFYTDDSLLWSSQDVVNWLPTVAQASGTRTEKKLATPPGLSYFTQCGDGPIRGARDVEGRLFVVSGNELYEIAFDGTPTLRGTIPGVGLVSMSHNKRGYGNQLLIVNGDAGYVWDTTAATLTKITDAGFPGSVMVDYLDHYLIQVEPWGRFWFHSNLDNATDYNTLDQYDPEASPDKIKAIAANQLEAVTFSQRTTEFFANTGAATNTFQSKRIVIERGIAGRNTLVKLDNTLMWLGNDGIFYRLNGYGAQPISPGPVTKAIAGLDWENAFGFTWEDKGYKVAYWTFPDGQTFGHDVTQPPGFQWHRRASYGLNRWRLNTATLWQGRWIGGDFQHGLLYVIDWDAQHEAGHPMVSERTGPTVSNNQNRVLCPYFELLFDTGGPGWDGATGATPPPGISGDLPGGTVGDSGTYQYTSTGSVLPHTFSILSGSLPPGATMNSSGLVTYTYTTSGSYSWVVQVEDANGNTASLPDTAVVASQGWMATYTGGSIKISPDGSDWSAAGSKPSDGSGIIWSPILGGYLVRAPNGDILASCAAVEGATAAVNVALRSAAGVWTRSTYAAPINADGGETIHTGTHYFMSGGTSGGTSKISATGANFTNIATLRCEAAALGNAFVIGTGGYFGTLDTTKIALDGTSYTAGTAIATGNTLAQRGAASDTSSPRRVCFAGVLGGGAGTIGIYSTTDDASTWTSHTNPFAAGHGLTFSSKVRVHYGLGRWFVFAGTRVAHGLTLDTLVLDSQVFPQIVNNADSDGEKLIACGNSGMLQKWTLAGGWVALTSGMSTTVFDVVASQDLP